MPTAALPATVFDGVIDVSHHNGAIDWPSVAHAGIALVFIKATQGAGFIDPAFAGNRAAAARAGILVVPYHFVDTADPQRQAAHFLSTAALGPGQPAMLDWETPVPVAAVVALGQTVAARIGRAPLLYYGWSQLTAASPELARWPLMVPEYPCGAKPGDYRKLVAAPPRLPPGRPTAWAARPRPYDFHQYTPSGRIAGIATPVDRSVWVGTAAELRAWYAAAAG
jgi:lysozyme